MNDPYLGFDGPAHWGDGTVSKGYNLEIHAGDAGWLPHIEITPDNHSLTYHFVRSFDEHGVYTPGYAIGTPLTNGFWDFGVYSLPADLPVPSWMPVAIERAGFGYDPVPNSERGRSESSVHRDQTELASA